MRDRADIEETMEAFADSVIHVCMIYLRDTADREDAFQDTFIKYAQSDAVFNGPEHRKAWLIRVAENTCKDMLKRASRRNVALDDVNESVFASHEQEETIEKNMQAEQVASALRKLDEKYRTILYLKYYEGYTAVQISEMLGMPENTIYTNLARGRKKLKEVLTDER